MRHRRRIALLLWLAGFAASGCNQTPSPQQVSVWEQQQSQQLAQLQELDRRANQLDTNNRDLHTQLAQAHQQNRLLRDQVSLLQTQLGDATKELRDIQLAKKDVEKRVEALQASTRFRGGASITANNSLQGSLRTIELPGYEVRQDGDVVRIEIPADRLFQTGAAQLSQNAYQSLDQVAAAIARDYPRQIIGIEGHTDTSNGSAGYASGHQLTNAQSVAVFHYLSQRSRLSSTQMFTMGYGPNHPVVSNATPAGRARNRRIELVIYPETAKR